MEMGKNIVLIGFMGTGKSTVGLKLAEKLKLKFIDMDKEIEKITGMTINELFRKHGEIRFRSEEKLMTKKLSSQENVVIATGGGTLLQKENVEALKENGILICLEASPVDIWERVNRKKGTRPLLRKDMQVEDIEEMLAAREPFYAYADYRVNTSDQELEKVVNDIIKYIKNKSRKV